MLISHDRRGRGRPVTLREAWRKSGRRPLGLRAALHGVLLLCILALVPVSACGLSGQGPVETVSVPSGYATGERLPPAPGAQERAVWFVRGAELVEVPRSFAEPRLRQAVRLLLAGPTPAEAASGLRTALPPQDLVVVAVRTDGAGTVRVAVGRAFTGLTGSNQLLATAQVVWTLTQFSCVDLVHFTRDGEGLEVPTDEGLVERPVGRADFRSVAP